MKREKSLYTKQRLIGLSILRELKEVLRRRIEQGAYPRTEQGMALSWILADAEEHFAAGLSEFKALRIKPGASAARALLECLANASWIVSGPEKRARKFRDEISEGLSESFFEALKKGEHPQADAWTTSVIDHRMKAIKKDFEYSIASLFVHSNPASSNFLTYVDPKKNAVSVAPAYVSRGMFQALLISYMFRFLHLCRGAEEIFTDEEWGRIARLEERFKKTVT